MSRSQEAAKARDIIRRRQRQEADDRAPRVDSAVVGNGGTMTSRHNHHQGHPLPAASTATTATTTATAPRQNLSVSPTPGTRGGHLKPVRITVSHQGLNGGPDGPGTAVEATTVTNARTGPAHARDKGPSPPPLIYSVPTTDTFGDTESLVLRPVPTLSPVRRRPHWGSNQQHPRSPERTGGGGGGAAAAVAVGDAKLKKYQNFRRTGRRQRKGSNSNKPRDFQYDEDFPSVSVQTVHTAQRSAFDRRPPLSLDVWRTIAEQGGGGGGGGRKKNMSKRMSPSLQHLKLLHVMQGMDAVRQVQFSPSTCLAADLFGASWDPNGAEWDQRKSGAKKKTRDGRYRSIDPVRATVAALPLTPPALSNKRKRLPRRSDVGFPDASADEIRLKQMEIANETEWEEASPRLVVLVTSDDLGRAVLEESDADAVGSSSRAGGDGARGAKRTGMGCSQDHLRFNGGGLPSMPYAGRELIQAKERNARHFGLAGAPAPPPHLATFLEPDPFSMLAPPLDAVPSPSQGWRPRPFHDRPAGMRYCLVAPRAVSLPADDPAAAAAGPLVCSMALYSLPASKADAKRPGRIYGKMSEEFTFPAGDWTGFTIESDSAPRRDENRSLDPAMFSALRHENVKAVFSFDPLAIGDDPRSLYVVVQVFRVSQEAAAVGEKGGQQKAGTQLLSPFRFCVAPLLASKQNSWDADNMQWPMGETRTTTFNHFPQLSESQDAFVARLSSLVLDEPSHSRSRSAEDVKSGALFSPETQIKRRGVGRLFKANAKPSSQATLMEPAFDDSSSNDCPPGECSLFVSSLSSDFLQSLLATPRELDNDSRPEAILPPKILVDVTGDLAVLMDSSGSPLPPVSASPRQRKRSNLKRLPASTEPAGYLRMSEFREVLYLPARPEKHYDVDLGQSYRSLLNLLYLYPRFLRLTGGSSRRSEENNTYTIRIQVLQAKSYDDAPEQASLSVVTLKAFHSPLPWCGPALLDQIFTKSFGGPSSDLSTGIPVRDEIKVRLPPVLDGSFSLRFELYRLENGSGEATSLIANALIPLSSSHSRDVGRVATIIPNGNHRLKLGDFQLQLETRLVSAIHVGDASVATVLRDFPCEIQREEEKALLFGQNRPNLSMSRCEPDESFVAMLAEASPGAVTCHFEVLLFIHLCNVVRQNEWNGYDSHRSTSVFMANNMMSLFAVFRKVKERFLDSRGGYRHDLLKAFIKRHVDTHDERLFGFPRTPLPSHVSLRPDTEADSAVEVSIDPSISLEDSGLLATESEDTFHEVAVRIKTKPEALGYQSPRTRNSPSSPFSRVAYGATKMDRMRIEAELHGQSALRSHFFEDDETIATNPTLHSIAAEMVGADVDAENEPFPKILQSSSNNSLVRVAPASGHEHHAGKGSGSEFAQRVRTVAQVVLAPCVGPSLSNILAKSTSPQSSSRVVKVAFDSEAVYPRDHAMKDQFTQSDSDDDIAEDIRLSVRTLGQVAQRIEPPMFKISSSNTPSNDTSQSFCGYEYESIFLLWQNAWLQYVEAALTNPSHESPSTKSPFTTFPIPPYFGESAPQAPIYAFYANMDILLPLCLKSLVLRYSDEVMPYFPRSTKALLDDTHMIFFENLMEILARGLLGQALYGLDSAESREAAIIRALSSAEVVLDFIVGLFGILHPEHMNSLLKMFFKTLRDGEIEHLQGSIDATTGFEWSIENLQRVRASRQLRLRAVEALAGLPSFIALNFPSRAPSARERVKAKRTNWCQQYLESSEERRDSPQSQRQPVSGWLVDILLAESLSICALSCEAVVAEAIAHVEVSSNTNSLHASIAPTLKKRPGAVLKRSDLLMFQSLAVHGISCVYELFLRRHSMDIRFQSESGRDRIACLFAGTILDKSLTSSRWLARLESTHKVRSLWLLCFVYVLQEAPAAFMSNYIRSICSDSDARIHRFIRLLRLSSSTFLSFVDLPRHANFPSEIDKGLSPWLLQESFNTVVAATIMVIEECAPSLTSTTSERMKVMTGIMDLLLQVLSTPQSVVTHLRVMGGALQCLEVFGVEDFLEAAASSVQHWFRVVICLMNSTSLAVRAVSVDFIISLLGMEFDRCGNIDSLSTVFATVLPEVAAREIALFSVSGLVSTSADLSRCLWPLRRTLADLESANPLDDDRIDPSLPPILSVFSRACQAVLDSVLLELRLKGPSLSIVGTKVHQTVNGGITIDADEESLLEAASFFDSESAPMQRLRWLLTLEELHEAKGAWLEAVETLFQCSQVIFDSTMHLKHLWRPSTFALWSDSRRSIWLDTVGEDLGQPDRGNIQVMEFAEQFLEPRTFLDLSWKPTTAGKLRQPTVSDMSELCGRISKQMVKLCHKEAGLDNMVNLCLGTMLKDALAMLESHMSRASPRRGAKWAGPVALKRRIEDEGCCRRLVASISGDMVALSEKLLKNDVMSSRDAALPAYVALRLSGKEPQRCRDNTDLPAFLDCDTFCICRVPHILYNQQGTAPLPLSRSEIAKRFGSLLGEAICGPDNPAIVVVTEASSRDDTPQDENLTYLHAYPVESVPSTAGDGTGLHRSKSFFFRKHGYSEGAFRMEDASTVVELKVAHEFPYTLSRQRVVLTSEIGFQSSYQ